MDAGESIRESDGVGECVAFGVGGDLDAVARVGGPVGVRERVVA